MIRHVTIGTLAFLLAVNLYGQQTKESQAIVAEGRKLYKSELASWHGTDVVLALFPDLMKRIGGYFSYPDGEHETCLFYSNGTTPRVIATVSFDSTCSVRKARLNKTEREMSSAEYDLYSIRRATMELIRKDTLFKMFPNTSLNLIPIIEGETKKVFVVTGPQKSGVVIFGNDYLVTFTKDNQVESKRQLHRNIIPIEYSKDGTIDGEEVIGGTHIHLPETGDFITSTDICTLMLYEEIAGWKMYTVTSEKYVSFWNCETNTLDVGPIDDLDTIYRAHEKRMKKKE